MQPFQYDLRSSAAKDNSITHAAAAPSNLDAATTMRFAASRSKPAPIYGRGNTKWQHSCSHSNAICHRSFKKRIELRTQEQPLVAKHIGGTIRDRNDRSRTRRTHEVPFIAGCSHFTRKNTRFRAPASSPQHSPCNIHAAITLRFAASRSKPAPIYGRGNTKWQQLCSHSNAICHHSFKKRIELRTQEQPLVAKHIGGTIRDRKDRSRTRRTDEVPFIAGCSHFTRKNTRFRAPASSPQHSPCNIHAAITLRFAASRSKPAPIYERGNTKWQQSCSHSTAICHHSFKKRIELRTQEQPLVAKHIGGTIRDRKDRSRTRRTDEVPFIAGCSHFTRKNTRFRAPASSPQHSPCNIHAAITLRFAASRSEPAPIYGRGKTKWQQSCSHSNAICHHSFKKRIELRTQEQPLVAKHIGGTIRDRKDRSRTRRTHEVPFIAGCSHFTRKNTRFRAPASSPQHSPCNIHAAITLRFAASRSKPAPIYGRGNTKWQQSCSHSNAICHHSFKKRIELRTQEQPLVAKHIGGTIRDRKDRSRARRTHEVPFIAGCSHFTRKNTRFRAPASSPKHSPCNIHAAIPMRSATTSLPHHFPSSPLPFLITSHRQQFHRFSLPFLITSHRHHFPSSPLPIVTTSLPHHSPSSPLPFVTTSLPHHFPSSPLPIVATSRHHHFPSSPLPFITTSLRRHFRNSEVLLPNFLWLDYVLLYYVLLYDLPPFLKVNFIASYSCVMYWYIMYCYIMYCYMIYHPSSRSISLLLILLWCIGTLCIVILCIVIWSTTLPQGQFHCFLFFCDVLVHYVLLHDLPPFIIVNCTK